MNQINPKKLLHSKWTAVHPVNKEKHFLVTEMEFDEEGNVIHGLLEAVISNRQAAIDRQDMNYPPPKKWGNSAESLLKNAEHWRQGWL